MTNSELILGELGSLKPMRHSFNPPVSDFVSPVPPTETMNYLTVWQKQGVVMVVGNDGYSHDGVENAWELTAYGYMYGQQLGVYPVPEPPPPGAGGLPEAPQDGAQYGRQSASWTPIAAPSTDDLVKKSGDTMTGTLVAAGNPGVTVSSGGAELSFSSFDRYLYVGGNCYGIRLQGMPGAPKELVFTDQGTAVYTKLSINSSGDLIATAWIGPNAGKTVNLTAGKWA